MERQLYIAILLLYNYIYNIYKVDVFVQKDIFENLEE